MLIAVGLRIQKIMYRPDAFLICLIPKICQSYLVAPNAIYDYEKDRFERVIRKLVFGHLAFENGYIFERPLKLLFTNLIW